MLIAKTPTWMQDMTLVSGFIIAVSGATTVVVKVVLSSIKAIIAEIDERIEDCIQPVVDDLHEYKTLATGEFAFIRHELTVNGGKSLKDIVKINEASTEDIAKQLECIKRHLEGK